MRAAVDERRGVADGGVVTGVGGGPAAARRPPGSPRARCGSSPGTPPRTATGCTAGASSARSDTRSRPRPTSAPASSTTRNVMRRWSGSAPRSNAVAGTGNPPWPGEGRGRAHPAGGPRGNQRRQHGAHGVRDRGTNRVRSALGSDRSEHRDNILATAGHLAQGTPRGESRCSRVTGTSTVTPSSGEPGSSNAYASGRSGRSGAPNDQTPGYASSVGPPTAGSSSSRGNVSSSGCSRRAVRHHRSKCAPDTTSAGMRAS